MQQPGDDLRSGTEPRPSAGWRSWLAPGTRLREGLRGCLLGFLAGYVAGAALGLYVSLDNVMRSRLPLGDGASLLRAAGEVLLLVTFLALAGGVAMGLFGGVAGFAGAFAVPPTPKTQGSEDGKRP